jgi:hypothetical protein
MSKAQASKGNPSGSPVVKAEGKLADDWEIEIAYWIDHLKVDPADARAIVICRWAYWGNFQPLAAALRDGPLDSAVRGFLIDMIDTGRLAIKRGRGAQMKPWLAARDLKIKALYKNRKTKSVPAIEQLAKDFGVGDELVRRAKRRAKAFKPPI